MNVAKRLRQLIWTPKPPFARHAKLSSTRREQNAAPTADCESAKAYFGRPRPDEGREDDFGRDEGCDGREEDFGR